MASDAEVRSGARLIRIVEALATRRGPLSGTEIASRLDIPPTTASRILATLVRMRWADRDAAGGYRLASGFVAISGLVVGRSTLIHLSKPVLEQVAELSGLQSHLGVLAGARVTFLARASRLTGDERPFHLGASQPIHCTAAGKLLFAFLRRAERDELFETLELKGYTPSTITDREALRAELEAIREKGYSVDPGEFSDFWRSQAVPVFRGDDVVAAITCGGPADAVEPDKQGWVRHEMLTLAEELSHRLA